MATFGAAFAEIYVLRKVHMEKLKRMEKQRAKTEATADMVEERALEETIPNCSFFRKAKKIHPSSIPSINAITSTSQVWDSN
ncbi:hypothetical protein MRB53_015400 [Persea americana]|uniref:Uncharacterized protein n=1 Tax=Persea americana TaxID=3435 RepID=A0ACC2KE30_PERAE|nr:hypothetical protein MRB53_015400 [Persea americana]